MVPEALMDMAMKVCRPSTISGYFYSKSLHLFITTNALFSCVCLIRDI